MGRVRRTRYLLFRLEDTVRIDAGLLFRGTLDVEPGTRFVALSAVTGEELPLAREDLDLLDRIPEDGWVDAASLSEDRVERLARAGLLVTDAEEAALASLRARDEALAGTHWHSLSAVVHARTRWRDVRVAPTWEVDVTSLPDADVARALELLGAPPPHFHESDRTLHVEELPLARLEGGLRDALDARRTTRAFDRRGRISRDELSLLLREAFGCHGTTELHGDWLALKKTSPSGGSLHPIEVYPLIAGVDGLDPGLYHYRVRDHALALLEPLTPEAARGLGESFVAGQSYFADAQALFVLSARFGRSFWKYRQHDKAYPALLMEVGHLSQTLYLVAAELGLGAFVTAAINAANIDERLGFETAHEGALAICGCGTPSGRPSELEPVFEPYEPPRS